MEDGGTVSGRAETGAQTPTPTSTLPSFYYTEQSGWLLLLFTDDLSSAEDWAQQPLSRWSKETKQFTSKQQDTMGKNAGISGKFLGIRFASPSVDAPRSWEAACHEASAHCLPRANQPAALLSDAASQCVFKVPPPCHANSGTHVHTFSGHRALLSCEFK